MAWNDHKKLVEKFRRARGRKKLIWDMGDASTAHCPHYVGQVYLYADAVLVHELPDGGIHFGTNDEKLAKELRMRKVLL